MTTKQDIEERQQAIQPQKSRDAVKSNDHDRCLESNDEADSSEWEGFSDVPDSSEPPTQQELGFGKGDAEDSEWEGFSEALDESEPFPHLELGSGKDDDRVAPDPLGPDHYLSILDKLVRDIKKNPNFLEIFRGAYHYDIYVKDSKGAEAMKDRILKSLDPDLLQLIHTGKLRLRTPKKLKKLKKPQRNQPGIYTHVICDPNDPDVIGIYVGSTMYLLRRSGEHKGRLKNGRISRSNRKRKTKAQAHTLHEQFWANQGMQDFWLCFPELDLPKDTREADDMKLFLNILENYTVLLFRGSSGQSLRRDLLPGAKLNPYPWLGLNIYDPLRQFRSSKTYKGKKGGVSFAYAQKSNSLLNIVFRYTDPSRGDRGQMPLRCSRCLILGHRVDRTPRYEISTRVYLAHLRLPYDTCSPDKEVLFIPADTSIPSKHFVNTVYAHKMAQDRQQAKDMKFLQLKARIKSQGFSCPESRKEELVERVDNIRK